ncbi:phosphopantetheine-binding protein [Paenibacillus sp. CN-4]|uniref:phosphopantetheine-binding protein n=1 Tax=Paenibacillus nanchangensis TaxID=3348343 RepID=UPI003979F28A
MMSQLQQQVEGLLRQFVKPEVSLASESTFTDLEMDSLTYIKFIVAVEQMLHLDFDPYLLVPDHFHTVGDLTAYLWSKADEGRAGDA